MQDEAVAEAKRMLAELDKDAAAKGVKNTWTKPGTFSGWMSSKSINLPLAVSDSSDDKYW